MIQSNTPDVDLVEFFHYYDLTKIGFNFKKSETGEENKEIIDNIIKDFSSAFNIAPRIVKDAFASEYLSLRTTEDILILYNYEGNDDVYRIYTNVGTPTFKLFMAKNI